MTYAATQVSYWVGQANDLSTGLHPTGWVSGQRWSVTASQWQGMYNTEYANARDTSTGTHPNGWSNGQMWSTTSAQWQQMYNDEVVLYNNMTTDRNNWMNAANYVFGPSRVYNSGSSWEALYNNEVNLYNDMVNQKNNWQNNANYVYGPTRSYGSGDSWESMYNVAQANYLAYVNYYNDMVNQRNTWQSRADQAWGPNRVWNSGESWEAAYNRVLPPALSILSTGLAIGSSGTGGNWVDAAVITVNRTGYWAGMVHFYFGGGAGAPYGGFVRFRFGGTIGTQQNFNNPAPGATNYGWHTGYDGAGGAVLVSSGTQIAAQMNCNTGMGMNGNMWLVFCPTPQYPH